MIDAISEAEGCSCALYPIPYGQGRKPGMNAKKLSGIRGGFTRLGYCSVLGSGRVPNRFIPEAPELHVKLAKMPRGVQ